MKKILMLMVAGVLVGGVMAGCSAPAEGDTKPADKPADDSKMSGAPADAPK